MQEVDAETVGNAGTRKMTPFVPSREVIEKPIGNDMMAVARRIQERARVLNDEKKKAESIRSVLLDLRQRRQAELTTNQRQRRHLLQTTNERNAVELEVFRVQESIDDCRKRAKFIDQETLESQQRIQDLTDRRLGKTKSFYGPNMAKMETYIKVFEDIVESKEKVMEARKRRLEELRGQIEDAKQKEESILRETNEIQENIDREEQIDSQRDETINQQSMVERENHAITALSNKVREAIAARSSLRKKLRLAQTKHDNANSDMLFWEGNSIQKLIGKK